VLTADRVDAVNTYEKPNSVVPRPISARVTDGRIALTLPPKSVTVLSITQ
jgi:alpha-N-arabinofuranosidase